MHRVKLHMVSQRTISGERAIVSELLVDSFKSSHGTGNCSCFHQPEWRDLVEYTGLSIETPKVHTLEMELK